MIAAIKAAFIGVDLARIGLWLLVGLSLGLTIWGHGYFKGSAKLDHYKGEQAQAAAKIVVKQGAVTERVITRYIQVKGATELVTRDVEREVVRYAETNPDGLCIDDAWRRLHDRAALNALPAPAGRADEPLRAPGVDPGGLRFPYRVPGAFDRHGELREASRLRGPDGRVAGLDH